VFTAKIFIETEKSYWMLQANNNNYAWTQQDKGTLKALGSNLTLSNNFPNQIFRGFPHPVQASVENVASNKSR
jgi:hypothetical protein